MTLSPAMATGLQATAITIFYAVRIELPDASINLIDGSGSVTFPVNGTPHTFISKNDTFGTLLAISSVEESFAAESPSLQITLAPPTSTAIATLTAVRSQGSPVYLWCGLYNNGIGQVIGSPELLFSGRIDFVKTSATDGNRACEIEVASVWDRLFIPSEGERLNHHWHSSIWPGETGLSQSVNSVVVNPIWGSAQVQPTSTPGTPGGGSTGNAPNPAQVALDQLGLFR